MIEENNDIVKDSEDQKNEFNNVVEKPILNKWINIGKS